MKGMHVFFRLSEREQANTSLLEEVRELKAKSDQDDSELQKLRFASVK